MQLDSPNPVRPAHLLVDGNDDAEGCGLFVLSALHLVADSLGGVPIRVLCPIDAVSTAAEVLRWDTGLLVEEVPRAIPTDDDLAGAALYVAVVKHSVAGLMLPLAAAMGVRPLIAIQFPPLDCSAEQAVLARAAHDPRAFGGEIAAALGRPLRT